MKGYNSNTNAIVQVHALNVTQLRLRVHKGQSPVMFRWSPPIRLLYIYSQQLLSHGDIMTSSEILPLVRF